MLPDDASADPHKKRVLIDLGHGVAFAHGYDPGTILKGAVETRIVERIGEKLKAQLEASGYEAVLSRGDERGVLDRKNQLLSRAKAADAEDADVFISLHTNSHSNQKLRGTEIFVSRKDEGESRDLAHILRDALGGGTVSGSRFVMLEESIHEERPAALVETGFLTNPNDHAMLTSNTGQEKIAAQIAAGLDAYFDAQAPLLADASEPKHGLPSGLIPTPNSKER